MSARPASARRHATTLIPTRSTGSCHIIRRKASVSRLYDGMMAEGMGISFDRWFTNLKTKGNTGSASIYIILEELVSSGRVQPLQRILCFVPESARFTFSLMHLTAIG